MHGLILNSYDFFFVLVHVKLYGKLWVKKLGIALYYYHRV